MRTKILGSMYVVCKIFRISYTLGLNYIAVIEVKFNFIAIEIVIEHYTNFLSCFDFIILEI